MYHASLLTRRVLKQVGVLLFGAALLVSYALAKPPGGGGTTPPAQRPPYVAPPPGIAPWPAYGGDLRSSGKSPFLGPVTGSRDWQVWLGNAGSVSIDVDDTIYVAGSITLISVNPDGSINWSFDRGSNTGQTPAIGAAGNVYISGGGRLYAVDPQGPRNALNYLEDEAVLWAFPPIDPDNPEAPPPFTFGASAKVVADDAGNDVVLIVSHQGVLYALDGATGGTIFTYGGLGNDSVPAVDEALGRIYTGGSGSLRALTFAGQGVWQISLKGTVRSPVVGLDGTIYVTHGDSTLAAVGSDGRLKWKATVPNQAQAGTGVLKRLGAPAIDEFYDAVTGALQTTIVVGSTSSINAFRRDGSLKWKYTTQNYMPTGTPVIGPDGVVYLQDNSTFYAIAEGGNLLWSSEVGGIVGGVSSAIGSDGTLYVAAEGLHAFRDGVTTTRPALAWLLSRRIVKDAGGNVILVEFSKHVTQGETLELRVGASDWNGRIVQVDFYRADDDGSGNPVWVLLDSIHEYAGPGGELTIDSWTEIDVTAETYPAGQYTFAAVAHDNDGNESNIVWHNVEVLAPQ